MLVTKATELFIGHISKLTFQHAEGQRRRTVKSEDLDAAVHNFDELEWLHLDFQKAPWLAPKPEVKRRAAAPTSAGADITSFMGGQAKPAQAPEEPDAGLAEAAADAEEQPEQDGEIPQAMDVDSGAVAVAGVDADGDGDGVDGAAEEAEAEAEADVVEEAEAGAGADAGAEAEAS